MHRAYHRLWLSCVLLLPLLPVPTAFAVDSSAAGERLSRVPQPLQPWIDWALTDPEAPTLWRCPVEYADPEQHQCVWVTGLALQLANDGGDFSLQVRNDAESWLLLPGHRRHWPQLVQLDGKAVPVMEREGQPTIKISSGDHRVTGRFLWREMPESVRIPHNHGLLSLQIEGQPVLLPRLGDDGILWLRQRPVVVAEQDQLEARVFRLLSDDIPFTVTTRLELRASGQAREEWLGPVLPPDFVLLNVDSPLPARVETDGRLRVRLTPGAWTITLTARHVGPIDRMTRPEAALPWPAQEIWSVQAHNALRVVQIEGAPAVDPVQTQVPEAWRRWPAYLVQQTEGVRLNTKKRGAAEPVADQLRLDRTLWMDFSGTGYTVQDRWQGMLGNTRLEAAPDLALGRVSINGQDQLITRLASPADTTTPPLPARGAGVEVRQWNSLDAIAESRLEPADLRNIPAVGWQIAPQSVHTRLHLPPGWRLLATKGPDSSTSTWLSAWNLAQCFIVMIVAFGFKKLWGFLWGLIALCGMVLTAHEVSAPFYLWPFVLMAVALHRVLPESGIVRRLSTSYRNICLFILVVVTLSFTIHQVRLALYPQLSAFVWVNEVLSFGAQPAGKTSRSAATESPMAAAPAPRMERALNMLVPEEKSKGSSVGFGLSDYQERDALLRQKQYLLDQKVQTGPGLPNWHWRQADLYWNNPVAADERLQLWLLPPHGTQIAIFAGLLLVLAMVAKVFRDKRPDSGNTPPASTSEGEKPMSLEKEAAVEIPVQTHLSTELTAAVHTWMVGVIGLAVLLLGSTAPARAELPDPEMLKALRERLIAPPDCTRCGDLAALMLSAKGDILQWQLTLHAQTETAVPLPLPVRGLIIRSVNLDQQPAILMRDPAQKLWLRLPAGIHSATITALVPDGLTTVQLPLPMAPGRVEFTTEGWQVDGYDEGNSDRPIQLTRQRPKEGVAQGPLQPEAVPPFVQVERTLLLDVDWQVQTTVRRLSQADAATVLDIPLLPGERVTTPGLRVRDGRVSINLLPEQSELSWMATLNREATLVLQAADTQHFAETWRLRAGSLWHVEMDGIPVVNRTDTQGQWVPEWRPWPGENVTLHITQPEGAPGNTVTIDHSHLRLRPGQRLTEAALDLSIRSSRGADHTITLPAGATLTRVDMNGQTQPLEQQGQKVTLPLAPGAQQVTLTWRMSEGMGDIRQHTYRMPVIDLGSPSVNARTSIVLPNDRWVLWAYGPLLGPAVLFWGTVLVILIGARVLARSTNTPLGTVAWFLLGLGLSQSNAFVMIAVVGWLLLLAQRKKQNAEAVGNVEFNFQQLGLAALTILALACLMGAIQHGLLGVPEMYISGNGSDNRLLQWYQDRSNSTLPTATVFSVPILVYRGLMLLWALWLARALLHWLRWGWECFSTGGVARPWRKSE